MSHHSNGITGVPLHLAVGTTMTILTETIVSAVNRPVALVLHRETLVVSTKWMMTYPSDPIYHVHRRRRTQPATTKAKLSNQGAPVLRVWKAQAFI
jgi:hypothetical protein